jgi:oxysterol-binding protein 1
LVSAKDQFPRILTGTDFVPTVEVVVSTEKLRARLLQEGLSEAVVKECESIMLSEVSDLQNQLQSLHQKHVILVDKLRQLEVSYFLYIFSRKMFNWISEVAINLIFFC